MPAAAALAIPLIRTRGATSRRMMSRTEWKRMLASYLRVAITAMLSVIAAGETSWQAIFVAGALSVIPPVLRWLNPNDEAYGLKASDD